MENKLALKRILYDNLNQFVEDINRNFAAIQNSPLYKGIPGDDGKQGLKGLTGERGSHFYFVKINDFLENYPKEITNGSSVSIEWLNAQLKSIPTSKKLIETLGVVDGKFVNNDIIVLTNSDMIEYDVIANAFVKTGISFYQQGSLVSSIEQKIENYVKIYVDKNPIINSLRNIWIDYPTYGSVYAQTSNTYITNRAVNSSMYVPSLGADDVTGVAINHHKYFGYSRNVVEDNKATTTVLGSIGDYRTLLDNTIRIIDEYHYNTTYVPNKTNIPTLVLLQDTVNNGLLFGYKGNIDKNEFNQYGLARFGSIFKDYETESNIHIKSDQGDNISDFSEILLNRLRLYYAKTVHFGDDLTVDKDLRVDGNFNNKWFRTAEFIKTKYKTADQSKVAKVLEVGRLDHNANYPENYVADCIYRNISKQIELPEFSEANKRVVLTVEPGDSLLKKDYFIETAYITSASTNSNLNDISFAPSTAQDKHLINSKHYVELINKINAIQQYVKEKYWRRDEWTTTNRGSSNNVIPLLNVEKLKVWHDTILGNGTNNYFTSSIDTKTLTLGFNSNDSKLLFRGKNSVVFDFYNKPLLNTYSSANVVTTNNEGKLEHKYSVFNKYNSFDNATENNNLFKYLLNNKITGETCKFLIPTLEHLGMLVKVISATTTDITDTTWKKQDFTKNADKSTGEDGSTTLEVGKIPNIFVKGLVGGSTLRIASGNNSFNAGTDESLLKTVTKITLQTKTIIFQADALQTPTLTPNRFVTVNNDKNLVTVDYKYVVPENYPGNLESFTPTVNNPNNNILTAEAFIWLNKRLNNTIKEISGNYWRKEEYAPETGAKIPSLFLSDTLKVAGTTTIGTESNPNILSNNTKLQLGKNNAGSLIEIRSDKIKFSYEHPTNDGDNFRSKVLVTDNDGCLRRDIYLCQDTSDTENNDNLVPLNCDDKTKLTSAASYKTNNEHEVITGKQWKWLHKFMNAVKKRFINTFNRKETIDYVYDHMPVGSIIMWTKQSYDIWCESVKAQGLNPNNCSYKNIPHGWALCDGSALPKINGSTVTIRTPNLVDKFVRGVNSVNNANSEDGSDFVLIERKHLPNLTHIHNCEDIINEHSHRISNESDASGYFTGRCWSNRDLDYSPSTSVEKDYSNRKGATEFDLKSTNGYNKANFEICMMYKVAGAGVNIYDPINFRHDKDGTGDNYRRYDYDVTRKDVIGISANLTDIFKNFGNFAISSEKVTIQHTIDEFNIGTGSNSDIATQEKLQTIPKYYKVVYIMKYDMRTSKEWANQSGKIHDSRYDLMSQQAGYDS